MTDVNDEIGENDADGESDDDGESRGDTLTNAENEGDGLVVCDPLDDPLPLAVRVFIGEPVEVIDGPDDPLFVLLANADCVAEGDFVLLADKELVRDSLGSLEDVKRGDFVFAGFGLEDGERVERVERDGVRDILEDFVKPSVRVRVMGADMDGCDNPDVVSLDVSDSIAPVDRENDGELVGEREMPPVALSVVEISGVDVWNELR